MYSSKCPTLLPKNAMPKHQAGATDGLDLLQAQQDLATQEAALTQTRQQLIEQRNALALLFDAPPEQWQPQERPSLKNSVLPMVPAGLSNDEVMYANGLKPNFDTDE